MAKRRKPLKPASGKLRRDPNLAKFDVLERVIKMSQEEPPRQRKRKPKKRTATK